MKLLIVAVLCVGCGDSYTTIVENPQPSDNGGGGSGGEAGEGSGATGGEGAKGGSAASTGGQGGSGDGGAGGETGGTGGNPETCEQSQAVTACTAIGSQECEFQHPDKPFQFSCSENKPPPFPDCVVIEDSSSAETFCCPEPCAPIPYVECNPSSCGAGTDAIFCHGDLDQQKLYAPDCEQLGNGVSCCPEP